MIKRKSTRKPTLEKMAYEDRHTDDRLSDYRTERNIKENPVSIVEQMGRRVSGSQKAAEDAPPA